ncbi:hypothetical protein BD414DRAFT_416114, partial [Trametes punicea]
PDSAVLRIPGCVPDAEERLGWILFTSNLMRETGSTILAREGRVRSPLLLTMYRDGIVDPGRTGSLYYTMLLAAPITHLCFTLLASLSASHRRPLRVLHSTLCARVLLNLRNTAAEMSDMSLSEGHARQSSRVRAGPRGYLYSILYEGRFGT